MDSQNKDQTFRLFELRNINPDDVSFFQKQYEYIANVSEPPKKLITQHESNPTKNRYNDVYCLDKSRVEIGEKGSGRYIHANRVKGHSYSNDYICTQGPLANTVIDFWDMVWNEGVMAVVMLSDSIEDGVEVCAKYWPDEQVGSCTQIGKYKIVIQEIEDNSAFTIHTLIVQHCDIKHSERVVKHLRYKKWGQYYYPKVDKMKEFIEFYEQVEFAACRYRDNCNPFDWNDNTYPIVVHCNDGIGRSGAFVTFDIAMQQINPLSSPPNEVNITEIIGDVRKQRHGAVRYKQQLAFIFIALRRCLDKVYKQLI